MYDHLKDAHPDKAVKAVKHGRPHHQLFKARDWAGFTSGGSNFHKCYRVTDPLHFGDERHALICVYITVQKGDKRAAIAARLLAATKEVDVEKLRVEVKVPLKDGQAVNLCLKPTRSTGTFEDDVREIRTRDVGESPLSIATSAFEPRSDGKAGLSWCATTSLY